MNRFIIAATISLMVAFNVGCASASGKDYYEAIRKTAEAQALSSEAKYRALAQVAASGDGQAASAAVMAIAMSQDKTIVPQYIESSALKWAQVLTPTVGTLGIGLIQAGVAKNASNNATEVQMASMASNQAIQLGQQGMVTNLGSQWSATAAAGGAAVVELGLAGFDALNTAGDQTVTMGTAGLTAVTDVATAGFTQIGATAEDGMNATANVGLAGMTNLVTLGTTALDATETLGIQGMLGIHETNEDWLNYSTTKDTSISGIVADLNATIQQLSVTPTSP